jgi:hypothetical protein
MVMVTEVILMVRLTPTNKFLTIKMQIQTSNKMRNQKIRKKIKLMKLRNKKLKKRNKTFWKLKKRNKMQ